nr:uncharacterized protein LOC127329417 [Lolium perenne]
MRNGVEENGTFISSANLAHRDREQRSHGRTSPQQQYSSPRGRSPDRGSHHGGGSGGGGYRHTRDKDRGSWRGDDLGSWRSDDRRGDRDHHDDRRNKRRDDPLDEEGADRNPTENGVEIRSEIDVEVLPENDESGAEIDAEEHSLTHSDPEDASDPEEDPPASGLDASSRRSPRVLATRPRPLPIRHLAPRPPRRSGPRPLH